MVLNKLTAVEEDVIRHRYGIGCKEETLVKIAVFYGLARERIRQIEANALRKIFILLTEKRLPKKEPKPEKEESEEDQKRRKARLRVTQAMKRIDPVARDVLSRFYGINREGKQSIEEIAKIYGADITEIESIISRAHEAVEKSIKKIKDQ
jgi:DNA-directed RNA polymerase sigma subunit (sigma70/sigma32)